MMKKIITLCFLAMIFASLNVSGQTHRIWAIMIYTNQNHPVLIVQNTTDHSVVLYSNTNKDYRLRDEDGKEIKFYNMLPALGYMEVHGWIIPDKEEQIFRNISATTKGDQTQFLMYKEVSEEEWLQWVKNGIVQKKK